MVDISLKPPTLRTAIASCEVFMSPETLRLLHRGALKKGDAFTTAKIAGIQAAKKTSQLIPMCHPLLIEHVEIQFMDRPEGNGVRIEASVRITGKTGVEMEALTAVSIAALTIYDMAKSSDPAMVITEMRLVKKTGGKSDYSY